MLQTKPEQSQQSPANIIPMLLEQMLLETLKGRNVMPMAALCKRLGVRMSTLQRHLTLLESYQLVTMNCDDAGRWTTTLTTEGLQYCQSAEAA